MPQEEQSALGVDQLSFIYDDGCPVRVRLTRLPELLDPRRHEETAAPLVDRRVKQARRNGETARPWAALAEHRAVIAEPVLVGWLRQGRTTGLAQRLAPGSEEQTVVTAIDSLAAIRAGTG